ncbi:MAG: LD-carboxypeptidase [Bacteroidota bacterium]
MDIIKPPRLRKGDLIGLIAPASPPSSHEKIDKGVRYLERLGYNVKIGRHVGAQHGYLAGTDEERADDINEMLADRNVKALFAVRGGYGTPRLLDRINYRTLHAHPKILVGYSDLTALQLAMFRKTGVVMFSGPMVGVEMWNAFDPYTEEHFWRVLTSTKRIGKLHNPPDDPVQIYHPGKASGRLLGGNLSLLVSLLGTPYLPVLRNALLVLEDVDEAPHRIDRMFAQLRHAGILTNVAGLLLGKFTDCVPGDPSKPHLTTEQVLQEIIERSGCPVLANVMYGHISKKLTLPLGLLASIDSRRGSLELMDSAVS